ncbi:MAG: PD40 domain-containing protein [Anaerolineales bacterium]|nr:PD40 domain-containing protein [Anaerolineales bacterium]
MVIRHMRTIVLATLALLLLAGCSPALQTQVQRLVPRRTVASASVAPASPDNRLLVQGVDGNLYLASPDGTERFALTQDASPSRLYTQPTWSPDGMLVAFSRITNKGSALVTSRFDGSNRSEVAVPFAPFYINWSPTGDKLAYLSNWQVVDEPSIALRLVDLSAQKNEARTLAAGQPFYFSWAPDGEQLITHIGNERVEIQQTSGKSNSLAFATGSFPAPQWTDDGNQLLYATAGDDGQALVVSELDGTQRAEITNYDGRITFLQNTSNSRVAYVLTDADRQASTYGPLLVTDLPSMRTRELAEGPVVAFFWSPDGEKLAYLTFEAMRGRIGMRWNVWDGEERTPYALFFPTQTFFQNYLPFFDQYAQSHNLWAPDSQSFVFAGTLPGAERGVWVQPVDEGSKPVYAGPGVFASWSPQ